MDFVFSKRLAFDKELRAHIIALLIAVFGPLINLLLGHPYSSLSLGAYFYWATALLIYIGVLLPFTYKSPLTLIKLVFFGVAVEDFFSAFWRSLFFGKEFLPFYNWYTQHFPFLGSLGEPTPLILIPQWYLLALLVYSSLTAIQHNKEISLWLKPKRRRRSKK